MANIWVDGFGTYGLGGASGSTAVGKAMLAAGYASISTGHSHVDLVKISGDKKDEVWARNRASYGSPNAGYGLRVILSGQAVISVSYHVYVDTLSSGMHLVSNVKGSGFSLVINMYGAIGIQGGDMSSNGVIQSHKDHHVEAQFNATTGKATVYVDGVVVLSGAGIDVVAAGYSDVGFLGDDAKTFGGSDYVNISNIIIRDSTGTFNNTFPMGDRRVATLLPISDVPAVQGWTPRPLQKFGAGILHQYCTSSNYYGVYTKNAAACNPQAADFTLEGSWRFDTLPSSAGAQVLFSQGSGGLGVGYELHLEGTASGPKKLRFVTSTDGQAGTNVVKIEYPWDVEVDRWYSIAVCRVSGVLRLFIDGAQVIASVNDTDSYYQGSHASLGGDTWSTKEALSGAFRGYVDEFRLTIGAGRYAANYLPASAPFPRDATDPDWASVVWLQGWDSTDTITAQDKPGGVALDNDSSTGVVFPADGDFAFQVIDAATPNDHTFIEASLLTASAVLSLSALPADGDTVTVGQVNTGSGPVTAVYTFKTAIAAAYDVLIGADETDTLTNLQAAINLTTGAGTTYGTGTTVNLSVSAADDVLGMRATSLTPGSTGNAIAVSATGTAASWNGATLSGGKDIPGPSQFGFSRMPPDTTVVDSITLMARQWKLDSGSGKTQLGLVGGQGAISKAAKYTLGTTPTADRVTFEEDPDTGGSLTTQTALLMKAQIDRTE